MRRAGPIAISALALAAGFSGPEPFTPGTAFPDAPLSHLDDGAPARVSDYRGTKLVLHVFASW